MLDLPSLEGLRHDVILFFLLNSDVWGPSCVTSFGFNYFVTVRIITYTYCIINPMCRGLSVGNYLLPYLLLHVIMPSILE